jgi:hypothetical protein
MTVSHEITFLQPLMQVWIRWRVIGRGLRASSSACNSTTTSTSRRASIVCNLVTMYTRKFSPWEAVKLAPSGSLTVPKMPWPALSAVPAKVY